MEEKDVKGVRGPTRRESGRQNTGGAGKKGKAEVVYNQAPAIVASVPDAMNFSVNQLLGVRMEFIQDKRVFASVLLPWQLVPDFILTVFRGYSEHRDVAEREFAATVRPSSALLEELSRLGAEDRKKGDPSQ